MLCSKEPEVARHHLESFINLSKIVVLRRKTRIYSYAALYTAVNCKKIL